ncbi:unnamed protein product [Peniophora sp. CBMAI 1063]|nr:unnamed protein product [Peniophora sp. CBMAI 1063]
MELVSFRSLDCRALPIRVSSRHTTSYARARMQHHITLVGPQGAAPWHVCRPSGRDARGQWTGELSTGPDGAAKNTRRREGDRRGDR